MSTPLPVTLVTGFLGAGKTTLLRRLLKSPHGLRIGLVLNEFGQAGIDAVDTRDQAFVELTEGCACCLRNSDLVQAMQQMAERGDLDRVLVEPSGLADPLPLAWTLQKPELAGVVRLDAVVTVVDPLHHDDAGREEWEAQVRAADVVVLSKRDIAPAETVARAEAAIRALNPLARLVDPTETSLADLLLDLPTRETPADSTAYDTRPESRHSDFRAVSIEGAETYHLQPLEDLLESLPADIFRAKGIVQTVDDGWVLFHVVAGRCEVELDRPAPVHRQSRLAFFGRGLTKDRVLALLAEARHETHA